MDDLILILFIALSIPLLLMLGLLDKKSRLTVLFMFIGVFMCMFISQVNGIIKNMVPYDLLYITTTYTPMTEEIAKAIAVVYFAFFISDDRNTLLTLGMAVGIGFSLLENAYYLTSAGSSISLNYALIRVFGAGLMHGLCTALVAYGCSFVHTKKKVFYTGTFAILVVAIVYHATYNALVQSPFEKVGFILPIVTYIPFVIATFKERRNRNKKNDITENA